MNDIITKEAQYEYAGFWVRSWAASIDSLIITFICIIFLGASGYFINAHDLTLAFTDFVTGFLSDRMQDAQTGTTPAEMDPHTLLSKFDHVLMTVLLPTQIIFCTIYYAIPESGRWQGSIGKRMMGIKIVNLEMGRIGFFRAFMRNMFKIIPGYVNFFLPLLIFITIPFDGKKRGVHDMLCKTLVIYKMPKLQNDSAEPNGNINLPADISR